MIYSYMYSTEYASVSHASPSDAPHRATRSLRLRTHVHGQHREANGKTARPWIYMDSHCPLTQPVAVHESMMSPCMMTARCDARMGDRGPLRPPLFL